MSRLGNEAHSYWVGVGSRPSQRHNPVRNKPSWSRLTLDPAQKGPRPASVPALFSGSKVWVQSPGSTDTTGDSCLPALARLLLGGHHLSDPSEHPRLTCFVSAHTGSSSLVGNWTSLKGILSNSFFTVLDKHNIIYGCNRKPLSPIIVAGLPDETRSPFYIRHTQHRTENIQTVSNRQHARGDTY